MLISNRDTSMKLMDEVVTMFYLGGVSKSNIFIKNPFYYVYFFFIGIHFIILIDELDNSLPLCLDRMLSWR